MHRASFEPYTSMLTNPSLTIVLTLWVLNIKKTLSHLNILDKDDRESYPCIHTREKNPMSAAFEEALKTTFTIKDSSKATRRGFEDWVETLDKGLKVLDVFSTFESRFGRLSTRDQTILAPDKVIMFLQAVASPIHVKMCENRHAIHKEGARAH